MVYSYVQPLTLWIQNTFNSKLTRGILVEVLMLQVTKCIYFSPFTFKVRPVHTSLGDEWVLRRSRPFGHQRTPVPPQHSGRSAVSYDGGGWQTRQWWVGVTQGTHMTHVWLAKILHTSWTKHDFNFCTHTNKFLRLFCFLTEK